MVKKPEIRRLIILAMILLYCLSASGVIGAFEFSNSDRYTLPPNDTIPGDLYMTCGGASFPYSWTRSDAGGRGGAFIDGTILGDLSIAGGKLNFSGLIKGSLNCASQSTFIKGNIERSARVACQEITVTGEIGNDAVIFASRIELGVSSRINNDAAITGGEIRILGDVGRDLIIHGDEVIIAGKIGGELDIEANIITIEYPAEISGNVSYTCPQKIRIADDVIIEGDVEWHRVEKDAKADSEIDWSTRLFFAFCTLIVGLIMIPLLNRHTRLASEQIRNKPLQCLGTGFVFVCAAPIAAILLTITVIGIPTALILIFLYALFAYVAKIYFAIFLGSSIINAFRKGIKPKQGIAFILGLIALTFAYSMPVAGWIIYFGSMLFGAGAILLGAHECRRQSASDIS
ncbi:MAG: polymer-forming cytoskeletal protein [Candidatus Zixiibacteriota bacterium]